MLRYIRWVAAGDRPSARERTTNAFLQLADEEGFPHAGVIDFVDNRIDDATGTLQSWRAAIIPIAAIPVSLIGTFAVMSAVGFSLNTLSLFGLVLAIAADASARAAELARVRYRYGADSFLSVLDAERRLLEAQDQMARSATDASLAFVALYRALGGGWQNAVTDLISTDAEVEAVMAPGDAGPG